MRIFPFLVAIEGTVHFCWLLGWVENPFKWLHGNIVNLLTSLRVRMTLLANSTCSLIKKLEHMRQEQQFHKPGV